MIKIKLTLLKSKIHRATVKQADLNYVGSITIDIALMEKANLVVHEQVHVVDVDNGERFVTYVIPGERNSGIICLNGAAARKVQVGDKVIVMSYVLVDSTEADGFKPKVVFVDDSNKIIKLSDQETNGSVF